MPFSKSTFPDVFDPSLHEGNTHQAFNDYNEAWEISYGVACIGELKEVVSELVKQQQQQPKTKVFRICVFQGERLKTDLKSELNQDLAQLKQEPGTTPLPVSWSLQEPGEKIDSFISKIRQHAGKCSFKTRR